MSARGERRWWPNDDLSDQHETNDHVFFHDRRSVIAINAAIIVIRPTANEIDEQLSLQGRGEGGGGQDSRLSLSTARQMRAAGWIIHAPLTTCPFLFLFHSFLFFSPLFPSPLLFPLLFGEFRERKWEKVRRTNEGGVGGPETWWHSDCTHRYKSTVCARINRDVTTLFCRSSAFPLALSSPPRCFLRVSTDFISPRNNDIS